MDGLYTMRIEPAGGGKPTNAGVLLIHDGKILGGDAFFYYVGSCRVAPDGWSGELTTKQHTRSGDFRPAFGALDVAIALNGQQSGTALEGTADVLADAPVSYKINLQKIADA